LTKIKTIGFGFDPQEAEQHFMIIIPSSHSEEVLVFERFEWDEDFKRVSGIPPADAKFKVSISYAKWKLVKSALETEMNKTLKVTNKMVGKFKTGMTPIERLLGKEMMVLLWAIEDCDPSVIPNAIRNWCGLSREERWWLFTMTNATTGDANFKRGWRIALRYAITDNPILEEGTQGNILESLYQRY
jgi:hypothetical protein